MAALLLVLLASARGATAGHTGHRHVARALLQDQGPTTFSGCSCLNPWYADMGDKSEGVCNSGSATLSENLPWCMVNISSCAYPPVSQQEERKLLNGLSTLDWDVCLPRQDAVVTAAGCSCQPIWGYGGKTYTGATCQNPDDDAKGAWCMIIPGTCTSDPTGPHTTFHDGWDYCTATPAAGTTGDITPVEAPAADITLSGCKCAQTWSDSTKTFTGGVCAKPDNDPLGAWCRVDVRTCKREPEWSRTRSGAWDYCGPLSEKVVQPTAGKNANGFATTAAGCVCKSSWQMFYGSSAVEGNADQYGCGNPDSDESGDWCVVDESSCSSPPPGHLGGTKQAYDYCEAAAISDPVVKASKDNLPDVIKPPAPVPVVTAAGCSCYNSWDYTYDNGTVTTFTGGVCGRPDRDPTGEWCLVDPKTCKWAPYGQSSKYMYDYCQPPKTPRTVSGCLCLSIWSWKESDNDTDTSVHEQLYFGTYGNPDNDPLGPWCPVQVETCQLGLPYTAYDVSQDGYFDYASVVVTNSTSGNKRAARRRHL